MWHFLIIGILLILDQSIKYMTELFLKPINTYTIIKDIFQLTYVRNAGAAFGIMVGKQLFLIIITSIVILGLIYWMIRLKNRETRLLKLSLSFIIGGALGNLIDRIRLNYVIDMYNFTFINSPVFNTSDVFVILGTILLMYIIVAKKKEMIF